MASSMTLPAAMAQGQAPPVTSLMAFLAGEHAEALARVWPAPHEDYLLLPAARRHAAAILVARGAGTASQVQWLVTRARDGAIAAEICGPDAPGGVMKALGRMGEMLWPAEAYRTFVDLYCEDAARLLIRHMPALRPETLAVMAVLPPPLRLASVVSHLGTDRHAAADVAAAFSMALRVRGAGAGGDVARRFSRAKSRRALFEMAAQVVQPLELVPDLPPPDLPCAFQPVLRLEMLSNIALEFRNCLRDFVGDIAAGRMAIWVWRGEGGPAAIALRRDAAGWRLAEVRGRDNAELGDAALMEIVAAVKTAGVRTGEAWGQLSRRLSDRAEEASAPDVPGLAESWREQLALGYFWD